MASRRVQQILERTRKHGSWSTAVGKRAYLASFGVHAIVLTSLLVAPGGAEAREHVSVFAVQESLFRTEAQPPAIPDVAPPPCQVEESLELPDLTERPLPPLPDAADPLPPPAPPVLAEHLPEPVRLQRNARILAPSPVDPPVPEPDVDEDDAEPDAPAITASVACALVLQPVPGQNPNPIYPPSARRRHVEGVAMVRITVDGSGSPTSCEVIASSGSDLLDAAALQAARRWRFQNGPGTVDLPFRFQLVKPA